MKKLKLLVGLASLLTVSLTFANYVTVFCNINPVVGGIAATAVAPFDNGTTDSEKSCALALKDAADGGYSTSVSTTSAGGEAAWVAYLFSNQSK